MAQEHEPATILVVDDDAANLLYIQALLEPSGYRIEVARDGEEGLQRIEELRPDVVLLDVMMPRKDGFEVCQEVKSNPELRHTPVVLVTGLDATADRVRGLEVGADDLLSKPVNRHELLARIRSSIRVKRLNDQVRKQERTLRGLFELTTFAQGYPRSTTILATLARRAVEITEMDRVIVTVGPASAWTVAADVGVNGSATRDTDFLDGRVTQVSGAKEAVVEADGELGPYIGIPLRSFDGRAQAVLHAFGGSAVPAREQVQLLGVVGQRVASELQVIEYNHQLEREVDQRTSALRQAVDDLQVANQRLLQASHDTVVRLSIAAEYRDEDTAEHIERMSSYAVCLAREIGWSEEEQHIIKLASPMHDVGKIGIRDSVLRKRGQLTPDEWDQMKDHPIIGSRILGGSNSKLLQMAETIALTHHERFDGTGYPHAVRGDDIPLSGRIVALADVFDALTTHRVYKPAWPVERALDRIREESGRHFDPKLVDAFFNCLPEILCIYKSSLAA
ncbi:MAG: hypothetical protein AMXMBFR64_49010 [Myxococcales bacterium]